MSDWVAIQAARARWQFTGALRPDFAEPSGSDQESVWDYPRPPRLEPERRRVRVCHGPRLIADSTHAVRVLETASPPTLYIPPMDLLIELIGPLSGHSACEWKGRASYWSLQDGDGDRVLEQVAWSYERPYEEFREIAGFLAFYPALLRCFLGGERVRAQEGGLYGGWITPELRGPFKGGPGTEGW